MRRFFLSILVAAAGITLSAQKTHIPAGELHCRDPFITVDREDNMYYLIVQRRTVPNNQKLFAYSSKDLEYWDEAGFVYRMPEGYKCPDDWWAADTYFYNGKYYCFVTVSNRAKGILRGTTVLRSDNGPLGPYKNIIPDDRIYITPPGMQCLDGSLYIDEEGQPWVLFAVEWNGPNVVNHQGEVWCQKLNKELNGTIGDPIRLFSVVDASWARDANGNAVVTDAPFVWKDEKSGNLLMLWSSFAPQYAVGQAISKSGKITGPWEHQKELVWAGNGGHQMVFRDLQGKLKISFHAPEAANSMLTIKDIEIKNGKFQPVK